MPTLVWLTIPVGSVSGEGIGYSRAFANGTWQLNPNHLLFEPFGAWWLATFADPARAAVDTLRTLSVLAGTIAVGLFRWKVAPRLTSTRAGANHATAWFALSSAFLRLWISDEFHVVQMPFVVITAWTVLRYLEREGPGRAFAVGVATGLAALAFVSNLLLAAMGVTVFVTRHVVRRRPGRAVVAAGALALGTTLAAGPPLWLAWLRSPQAPDFLTWLTRYAGGSLPARVEAAYGVGALERIPEALARALYGAGSALVDLGPLTAAIRDGETPTLHAVAGAIACLTATTMLGRGLHCSWRHRGDPAARNALLVVSIIAVAVFAFAVFWNDSKPHFYVPLALAFAALAARGMAQRRGVAVLALGAGVVALGWNVLDVGVRQVFYPRHERMALLEDSVRGACLVVYPGFDEPERLLALSATTRDIPRLAITDLAVRSEIRDGLRDLTARIVRCQGAAAPVVFVDVFDTPRARNPWKFLHRLGWDRAGVEAALAPLTAGGRSRRIGPFAVRVAR